jgi:hypothetical protein
MTEIVAPPAFAGLVWDELSAPATDQFWALYNHKDRSGAQALRAIGIVARKEGKNWFVFWVPEKAAADVVVDTISQLELDAFAAMIKTSDAARAQQQAVSEDQRQHREMRDRKRQRARETLTARYGAMTDGELVDAAQREARRLYYEWGAFCTNSKKIYSFVATGQISLIQAVWLTELVDSTKEKVAAARETIVAKEDAVEWSDEEVILAVERLTEDDRDRAGVENGVGWSKADTSRGHWCWGMIRRGGADRDIGIDAARQILSKYAKQLGRRDARAEAEFDRAFNELVSNA